MGVKRLRRKQICRPLICPAFIEIYTYGSEVARKDAIQGRNGRRCARCIRLSILLTFEVRTALEIQGFRLVLACQHIRPYRPECYRWMQNTPG